jgi:hypothetical protein
VNRPIKANQAPAPPQVTKRLRIIQVVVVILLLPVIVFYLVPRVYGLAATPYRLDQATVHGSHYNPALFKVAADERVTTAALDEMDRLSAAVADVRKTDAKVGAELTTLVGQVRGDLQATLNKAGANVTGLVGALSALDAQIRAANGPVDAASGAVHRDRALLGAVLTDARSTAYKVHAARVLAEYTAGHLNGY